MLISRGAIELGGLESVSGESDRDSVSIPVDAGRCSVVIHLIKWKAEPGALAAEWKPSENALPDFLVVFSGESSAASYRTNVAKFDRS